MSIDTQLSNQNPFAEFLPIHQEADIQQPSSIDLQEEQEDEADLKEEEKVQENEIDAMIQEYNDNTLRVFQVGKFFFILFAHRNQHSQVKDIQRQKILKKP